MKKRTLGTNRKKIFLLLWGICCCSFLFAQGSTTPPEHEDLQTDSWPVHFHVGKWDLDLNFNGNRETLDDLINKIKLYLAQADLSITGVRIVGYASPEGRQDFNQMLSERRAETLKEYLLSRTNIPEAKFEAVGGGENWDELKIMVEASNLKHKQEITYILDNEEDAEVRKQQLKRLPDNTYAQMLRTIYPKLRSASSIQLLRRTPPPPVTEAPVVMPVVDTVYIPVSEEPLPMVIVPTEPCRCDPPIFGIKTNLAYWAAAIFPNIELEAYFAKRWSLSVEGLYRWREFSASRDAVNLSWLSPEIRYHVRGDRSYQGSYWGLYYKYGEFDYKLDDTGRQGYINGGGLSYGYIFKFNRFDCLFFDLGISAGYEHYRYNRYYWFKPCNVFDGHRERNYFGPTKLKASIVWRF